MKVKAVKTGLSMREEKLLMKFFDGECAFFEKIKAGKLLQRNELAQEFVLDLERSGQGCRSLLSGSADESVDLWKGIESRVEAEERAKVFLGERELTGRKSQGLNWNFQGLAWGFSGALVTACLALIFLQPSGGGSGADVQDLMSSRLTDKDSGIKTASHQVARAAAQPLELDWLKSDGHLEIIHDPAQAVPVIWVNQQASPPVFFQRDSRRDYQRPVMIDEKLPTARLVSK